MHDLRDSSRMKRTLVVLLLRAETLLVNTMASSKPAPLTLGTRVLPVEVPGCLPKGSTHGHSRNFLHLKASTHQHKGPIPLHQAPECPQQARRHQWLLQHNGSMGSRIHRHSTNSRQCPLLADITVANHKVLLSRQLKVTTHRRRLVRSRRLPPKVACTANRKAHPPWTIKQ